MKVTLESTEKLVTLVVDGKEVPARVWQGETEKGVRCHAFITRINCKRSDDNAEFERDLQEHGETRPEITEIPLRYIL